ncbi:MAG: hypothetical protein JWN75_425 [Candidatus Saccharibacteria bacterium]|nr:hypothetical protein [Candidatus Saccharibacteria bacterium]
MTRITKTSNQEIITAEAHAVAVALQTNRDVTIALLIVSLTINLFILVGWITLQVTTSYDTEVASFLFAR